MSKHRKQLLELPGFDLCGKPDCNEVTIRFHSRCEKHEVSHEVYETDYTP